jgi:hypothetical protein
MDNQQYKTVNRQSLLESLGAIRGDGAVCFDDERYIDFSAKTERGRLFEVGNEDGEAVQVELSRAELVALHGELTRTLLEDA